MKISKKAVNIICGVFEAVFILFIMLGVYYAYESITSWRPYSAPISTYIHSILVILIPFALLCLIITVHSICLLPSQKEKKAKQIERLQSKIDELKKDDE